MKILWVLLVFHPGISAPMAIDGTVFPSLQSCTEVRDGMYRIFRPPAQFWCIPRSQSAFYTNDGHVR